MLAVLLWVTAVLPVLAACPPPTPVRIPQGATATTLSGGVVRGERACYTLTARQGQLLSITQADTPDTNIVFQVYRPPWRLAGSRTDLLVRGTALPGTEEGNDARHFTGLLPVTGDYLLVIGTSRGSGEYRLYLDIR
ncbi:MAG: hypothetical protein AB7F35_19665 [Acetobacteraceae bacterium]